MSEREWWKEAIVYQIYPRSFNDSDGDGVGDIPGIVEKVDYLEALGVDVVWLNPVYESPMADNGYDIADYRAIHPRFGTMADWEHLLEELHDRDMRLIMDLVVNHTSEEHEWFVRSRAGEPAYRDHYVWREGEPDGPVPNNWESFFRGSAWRYDDEREAYFLHLYDESQPDLNWEDPDVRADVFEMMRWWLEKGIDGFRMDVINLISKPDGLPDGDQEIDGLPVGAEHYVNGPNLESYLEEMYEEALADYDAMTVGETVGMAAEEASAYIGDDRALNMAIHFEHMNVDRGDGGKYDPVDLDLLELKEIISRWQEALADEGWNCLYFSNHDQPRTVSRFGDDGEYREESAKMLTTVLCTLRGTPFLYQGQEIGMTNTSFEDPADVEDVWAENFLEEALEGDRYDSFEDVRPVLEECSRDNARTPMQWTDDDNAGFTDGEPWIGITDNYDEINVEAARADPDSIWHYYRELFALREEYETLVYGEYELLCADHPEVFTYERSLEDERLLVVCNFFGERAEIELGLEDEVANRLLGNYDEEPSFSGTIELRPYEAAVYRLS
ncbi:alpha amylase [Natronococcus amylolyticus DSM 10524]|uniref:Alpha amylase n=1 Tax=Natronococcus amylolyticus DSM 10524 TaxID=1227497 RepID=L9XIA4_9EURY|nr:alpha-glucosidase [Natronococcus amylolyticus]ELY61469.1 alpha amylase [Natronococcus amylolyticus DSM 10524]